MKNASKAYYLQVLGLSSNFNDLELKEAYRKEAKKWHPDLNKDDIYAEERLKLINEAYEFLKNSKNNKEINEKVSSTHSTNRHNSGKKASGFPSTKNIFSSRKIKKFIFYLGGFLAPLVSIVGIFCIGITGSFISFFIPIIISSLVLGAILFTWLNNYQINWYKKFGGKLSERKIRLIGRVWWTLGALMIAFTTFILILMNETKDILGFKKQTKSFTNPEVEYVKKGLDEGVEECRERYKNNLSIKFQDVKAFSRKFDGFKIEPVIRNRKGNVITKGKIKNLIRRYKPSCFEAKATPLNDKNTWFRIKINEISFGQAIGAYGQGREIKRSDRFTQQSQKTCGDSSKPGCEEYSWMSDGFTGPPDSTNSQ